MSLLIFSKLFTRRRLQREQEARQDPYLSEAREAACTLPAESVRHKRNVYISSVSFNSAHLKR
ncbi:MAG: hypothetical protein H0Z31_05690 [Bacillus sp. (in: Bacteria)]|nr:hypothetical protein [Bacillus sp. (in: firmicutes)]